MARGKRSTNLGAAGLTANNKYVSEWIAFSPGGNYEVQHNLGTNLLAITMLIKGDDIDAKILYGVDGIFSNYGIFTEEKDINSLFVNVGEIAGIRGGNTDQYGDSQSFSSGNKMDDGFFKLIAEKID